MFVILVVVWFVVIAMILLKGFVLGVGREWVSITRYLK